MSGRDSETMDTAIVAELRRLLDGVDDLWGALEAALLAPVIPGSLAAADGALPDGRFVRMYAGQALSTAIDHLDTWRLLVRGPTISVKCALSAPVSVELMLPIGAHLTLLRGSLENAARCRWHLEARCSAGIRVGRGYAARRDDQLERASFEASRETGALPARTQGMSAAERLAQLDSPDPDEAERLREAAGVRTVGYADTTSLMMKYGHERLFRLASGVAHGKEWALGATAELRPVAAAHPTAGVSHGIVTASDQMTLVMTKATVEAVRAALADLQAYPSKPADRAGRRRRSPRS